MRLSLISPAITLLACSACVSLLGQTLNIQFDEDNASLGDLNASYDPGSGLVTFLQWEIATPTSNGSVTFVSPLSLGTPNVSASKRFQYIPDANYTGSDSFTFKGVDTGTNTKYTFTCNITILALNDPPKITSNGAGATFSTSVAENQSLVTTMTATDVDDSDSIITYSVATFGDSPKFSVNNTTGQLTFNSPPDFENKLDLNDTAGDNTYVVRVYAKDDENATGYQDITVTVTDANDPPLISAQSSTTVTMDEDGSPIGWTPPSVTATDQDGDNLTWSLASQPTNGVAAVSGTGAAPTTFNYSPTTNWNGSDSFVARVTEDGGNLNANITVNVIVSPVNDPPVFSTSSALNAAENQTFVAVVQANDVIETADTITYAISGGADQSLFTINAATGALSFNSSPDFENPSDADSNNSYLVEVTATDNGVPAKSTPQAITVTVTDGNDGVVILQGTEVNATMSEDGSPVAWSTPDINASDPDGNETLTLVWTRQSLPSNGVASVSGIGAKPNIVYTPNSNFNGADSFLVRVTEPGGSLTDDITVNVTVTPQSDAPVITTPNAVSRGENQTSVIDVNATDLDSGETVTFAISGGADQSKFTVAPTTGGITFQTAPDFEASGSAAGNNIYVVDVTATDNSPGALTTTQTITVTVTNANEAPTIDQGASLSVAMSEDGSPNAWVQPTISATDLEGDTLNWSKLSGPTSGKSIATVTGTGATPTIAYTPDGNFTGSDSFVVQVSDGSLAATITVNVTVNPVDDAPVINFPSGSSSTKQVRENNATILTILVDNIDSNTSWLLLGDDKDLFDINASGALVFLAAPNFENPQDLDRDNTYDIVVRATDDNTTSLFDPHTLSVQVLDANDAPVIVTDGGGVTASVNAAENQSVATDVNASDEDGDTLTYSIAGGANQSMFSINSTTGVLSLNSLQDKETNVGPFTVDVTVTDNGLGNLTDSQTISVTIVDANDVPVITSDGGGAAASVLAAENQTAVTDVNATDQDGPAPKYGLSGGVDEGNFTINSTTGVLTFINPPDYDNPTDTDKNNTYVVDVNASDTNGTWDIQTITVFVTNVNEAPVISVNGNSLLTSVSVAMSEDGSPTGWSSPSLTVSDPDSGNILTWSVLTNATNGSATFSGTGVSPSNNYVPNLDFNGTDSFVVRVSDGVLDDNVTIDVVVSPVNDAPAFTWPTGSSYAVNVAENNMTFVLDFNASDSSDVPPSTALTWSKAGADAGTFDINATSGVLTFKTAPDFEANGSAAGDNTYVVVVTVTDDQNASTSQNVTLTVTDVNEPPVITQGSSFSITMSEDGNPVAWADPGLSATDPEGATVDWRKGQNPTSGTIVNIDAVTGALTYAPNQDFNGSDSFVITVSDGVLDSNVTITVDVQPRNDPPVISSGATTSFAENQLSTFTVAAVAATDSDSPILTYSFTGGADQAELAINGSTGLITFNASPDFESPRDTDADNLYHVQVKVQDGGGGFVTQDLNITVTNVNEKPTFDGPDGNATENLSVVENETFVIDVNASDVDAGTTLTYSLPSGLDFALFDVNATTGVVSFLNLRDFENKADSNSDNVYEVDVNASDGNLWNILPLKVIVTDVNDAPFFGPSAGNIEYARTVYSGESNAIALTNINATNYDAGEVLVYSLAGGADQSKFSINAATGDLSFDSGGGFAADYENPADVDFNNTYDVVVRATDNGANPLSADLSVTVIVSDRNDAPVILPDVNQNWADYKVTENLTQIATIKITDQDGGLSKPDVLVTAKDDNASYWMQNLTYRFGAGAVPKFSSKQSIVSNLGGAIFARAADLDGDSVDDVLAVGSDDDKVTWFKNDGKGVFIEQTAIAGSSDVNQPDHAQAADLDGDGDLDVITVSFLDDKVAWHENNGSGFFGVQRVIHSTSDGATFVEVGDVDGDGDLDVLSASEYDNTIAWYPNDGNGSFSSGQSVISTLALSPRMIAVADMDGDGDLDVLSASAGDGNVAIYENNGSGVFAAMRTLSSEAQALAVHPADLDGDGDLDVVFGSRSPDKVGWIRQTGLNTGTFEASSTISLSETDVFYVHSSDLDGDGDVDVLAASRGLGTVSWYANNGSGGFGSATVLASSVSGTTSVMVGDFDRVLDQHTFGIAGGEHSSLFDINATSGALRFISPADFETPTDDDHFSEYEVIISVTDGNATTTQTIKVKVQNENDPPFITTLDGNATSSLTMSENTLQVIDVNATDQEVPGTQKLTFSLSGGDDKILFAIDPSTGVLSFLSAPNFEAPGDQDVDNDYQVEVMVSDDGKTGFPIKTDVQEITVTVLDSNDPPYILQTSPVQVTVSEDAYPTLWKAPQLDAIDPESGVLTWSVSSVTAPYEGNASFTNPNDYSSLTYSPNPNYNGDDNFTVRVTDDGASYDEIVIAIVVEPVNDAPVITSLDGNASVSVNVYENQVSVTTLTAFDQENDSLSWSVTGGLDMGFFEVNASGVLSFKSPPDFENAQDRGDSPGNNTYLLQVSVSDGLLTDVQTLNVRVEDVNDNPQLVSNGGGDTAQVSVPENQTAIVDANFSDDESGSQSLTFSLLGDDNSSISINPTTGVLSFVSAPDFETPQDLGDTAGNNTYQVIIRIEDNGTPMGYDQQVLIVTVVDANDAPVITSDGGGAVASITVKENTTYVGRVQGSDEDGNLLSYAIAGGGADDANFSIDANGDLSFINAPDFEANGSVDGDDVFEVEVAVKDASAEDRQLITVTVSNVNDVLPVISTHDGNGSVYLLHNENQVFVADVNATDGDGDALQYSITVPADDANFTIDSNGTLSFATPPDFEANGTDNNHTVTISVGDGLNAVAQTFHVRILDLDESSPQFLSYDGNGTVVISIFENQTYVTDLNASDVEVQNLVYAFAGGLDGNASVFDLNQSTGVLSFKSPPDFESPTDSNKGNDYEVTVSASDVWSSPAMQGLTIRILDQNEVPQISTLSFDVQEDNATSLVILADDPEQNAISYSLAVLPSHGSLVGTPPNLNYSADLNFYGTDTFVVTVSDGLLESNVSISINVQPVNDAPNATADSFTFDYNGTPVVLPVLGNDSSAPDSNETLIITSVTQGVYGSVALDANTSSILFTSHSAHIGRDSFTYTITDQGGLSSTARVDLLVNTSTSLPGWRHLSNFGLYYHASRPWIQHDELGWLYVPEVGGEDNATWMWNDDLGWFWTGDRYYPSIYLQEFEGWSFIGENGSQYEGLLFDYASNSWLTPQQHTMRRLQVFVNDASNSISVAAVIDGFTALSRGDRDIIISELLLVGRSKTLTAMGISLGF